MSIVEKRSFAAVAVAIALLVGTPTAAHAAPAPRTNVSTIPKGAPRTRYKRGQQDYTARRWVEAGQAWSDVLDQIPENPVNRSVRMNLTLDSIAAYQAAYEETGDISHLETALDTYYRYFSVFKSTYGTPNIPRPVVVARFALRDEIARAKAEQSPPPAPNPPIAATVEPVSPDPTTEKPTPATGEGENAHTVTFSTSGTPAKDRTATGLIVGGAVTLGLGLGASSMIVVGAIGGQQARDDSRNPDYTDEQRAQIDRQGKTMNTVFIAGLVATPVLVGAGAALLGVGIQRRQKRGIAAVAPSAGPGFAGLTISGRF